MDNLVKIESKAEYLQLKPLLMSWIEAIHDYCEVHNHEENCWWHNERASISILAGAAWRGEKKLGPWVALEEFIANKRHSLKEEKEGGVEPDQPRDRLGRCDLYVSNRNTSFAFEAKQAWQSIGRQSPAGWANVGGGLEESWSDAGKLQAYEADYRYAATFIVPFVTLNELPDDEEDQKRYIRDRVESWLESCGGFERIKGKRVAYASYFPYECLAYSNYEIGRLFPGIVLVIEERKRSG